MALETGLRGRVVVVTGAAGGIGSATVRRFAAEGAVVAGWDLEAGDERWAGESPSVGGQVRLSRVDVTSAAAVEEAARAVVAEWGRIDVLVNNAGIVRDAQLVKWRDDDVAARLDEASFDAVVDVNLRGALLCTRAVVPHMIAAGGGVVLSASSVVALYGNFGQSSYAAAKAGLIAMSRTWARELGRHNIRVNVVAPGFIDTEMVRQIPPAILDSMVARTPLRRRGRPEEVAEVYVWLASNAATFVHGAVISVDGGLVIGT